jgi:hypothetical protein
LGILLQLYSTYKKRGKNVIMNDYT